MRLRRVKVALRRAGIGPLAALCACMAPITPVELEAESGATMLPTARVRIALDSNEGIARTADAPPPSIDSASIELMATGARGDLEPGGATNATLAFRDYALGELTATVRVESELPEFRLGASVGPAVNRLELELESLGVSTRLARTHYGAVVGLDAAWKVTPIVAPYTRISTALVFPAAMSIQLELGLEVRTIEALHLLCGYRYWFFQEADVDVPTGSTRLELVVHGLVVGGELRF